MLFELLYIFPLMQFINLLLGIYVFLNCKFLVLVYIVGGYGVFFMSGGFCKGFLIVLLINLCVFLSPIQYNKAL